MPIRKKYNPAKNIQRTTKAVLAKTLIIWHTFDDGKCELYHRNGQRIRVNHAIQKGITEYRYRWSLLIAAFGKDQFGKTYMKSESIHSNEPYTHAELCDFLNEQHKRIIAGMNKAHFIGAGWIASIAGNELSEAEAFAWFEKVIPNDNENMPEVQQQTLNQDRHTPA